MILESITNKVRSTIAGRLNSATSSAIRSGVSSLTGVTKEGATSSLGSIEKGGKFNTTSLTYPANVDGDPQQGHHIIFTIKSFIPGKVKPPKTDKDFNKIKKKIIQGSDFGSSKSFKSATNNQIEKSDPILENLVSPPKSRGGGGGSIMASKATVKTGTVISLYMPPTVKVEYNVKYADQEIGTLAMLGKDAIAAFQGAGSDTTSKLTAVGKSLTGSGAKEGVTNLINTTLDGVASGARALQQIESGKVITPRMEMMFEGVGRRSFSYTFAFIPKSAQEAKTIERIIYAFKENMMPEYSNPNTRREMNIPNVFDIQYMYQSTENKFLNKISTCFLQKIDVTYGADRYTAYDPVDGSPPPQKSSITLSFVEMETLSRDMIKEGF